MPAFCKVDWSHAVVSILFVANPTTHASYQLLGEGLQWLCCVCVLWHHQSHWRMDKSTLFRFQCSRGLQNLSKKFIIQLLSNTVMRWRLQRLALYRLWARVLVNVLPMFHTSKLPFRLSLDTCYTVIIPGLIYESYSIDTGNFVTGTIHFAFLMATFFMTRGSHGLETSISLRS